MDRLFPRVNTKALAQTNGNFKAGTVSLRKRRHCGTAWQRVGLGDLDVESINVCWQNSLSRE